MYKIESRFIADRMTLLNIDPYLYKFVNPLKVDNMIISEVNLYDEILINKIITKKIKKKLEIYLNYLITYIDTGDGDGDTNLRHALNDLTRYKSIIEYKYKKRLEPRYIELLIKKVLLIEEELKKSIIDYEMNNYQEEEIELGRSR